MPTQRSFAFPLLARLLALGLLLLWLGWWGMPSYAQPAGEPLQDIITLEAGNFDTCALTVQGGVKCWGPGSSIPSDVSGLSSGIIAVSVGGNHSCIVTSSGGVKCWGSNEHGQLGDGTSIDRHTPTDVRGLSSGIIAVAAGMYHTCALTAGGGLKCWGLNYHGQLGDGTATWRFVPTDVKGLSSGVRAVVAGIYHTCALTAGGGLKCWGDNKDGQLGDGTILRRYNPTTVNGLSSGVIAMAAGGSDFREHHTCAVTAGGGVKCWGSNQNGQLGDGTTTEQHTPTDVSGLSSGVIAVTAGGDYTCAVTEGGGVKCWGDNYYGQLGDGTTIDRHTPADVSGLSSGIIALAAGEAHTCALTVGTEVKCWGGDGVSGLRDRIPPDGSTTVDVIGLSSEVKAVVTGMKHTCALTAGGVKCWGNNEYGELGLGPEVGFYQLTPADVSGLSSGASGVAAGGRHACAVTMGGGVKCWGHNGSGQLGDGTTIERHSPVEVSGLSSGASAVAAGGATREQAFTCAVMVGGGLKCWGFNRDGQLGDSTNVERHTPTEVSGFEGEVISLALGEYHACAVTEWGGLKCWGHNGDGRLGDGTTISRYTPTDVIGLSSGVIDVAAGGSHTCAVTAGGGVKCWGWNLWGQLGDGTSTWRAVPTPTDVIGLSNGVTDVAAGGYHTCAVTAGGGVKCWGHNSGGELGDGTTLERYTPTDVIGLSSGVIDVEAGWLHTCALMVDGGVKCWGGNTYGQLGDGTGAYAPVPIDIIAPKQLHLPLVLK